MIRRRNKTQAILKLIYLSLLSVCFTITGFASNSFPDNFDPFADVSGPAPKIVFPITEYDFGTIAPGSKHEHKFNFSNQGDAVLTINKTIRSSCGCAVPKLDKTEYEPGESGTLLLNFNAKTLIGPTEKKIFIESNDPNHPAVTLWVKANVLPPVKCTPPQILFFLDDPNLTAPQLTIESADDQAFGIKRMLATGDAFLATFDPNNQAKKHTFQPKLDINSLRQNPRGLINIELTHPSYPLLRIPFMAIPEVGVQPVSLVLFAVHPNEPATRTVTLRSNIVDRPIAIKAIESEKNTVKMVVEDQETHVASLSMQHKLKLTITPP